MSMSPLPLILGQDRPPLVAQRDPQREPADHLDEHEGEEDPILEAVAAPAGGNIARGPGVRVRVGGVAPCLWVGVDWRGGAEGEGVGQEDQGDEEAEGGC